MGKRRVGVIINSFCIALIGFAIRGSYGVLLPEMLPALEISKMEAGLIYGGFFVAYTVFSPVLGLLGDRINIRVVLTIFMGILGIGTLLMGYSSSLMEAFFFFLLTGVGAAACWAPIVPLVHRWTSERRRGVTLSFVDAGASLGIAGSSFIMPMIVAAYDWRMGWKGLGIIAIFLTVITLFLVRDHPVENPAFQPRQLSRQINKPAVSIYLKILTDRRFLLIGLSYLCIGFSVLIPVTFVTTYAVEELKLRYDVAAQLVGIVAVGSMVGKLVMGALSDVLGRIKTLILCEILVAAGILSAVSLPGSIAIHFSMAVLGFGQGPIWPLYAVCATDYFSESAVGFIVGFWTLFLGIGFALSPVTAGWIADLTGVFMWPFMLAVFAAIISMFLLHFAGKKVSSAATLASAPETSSPES